MTHSTTATTNAEQFVRVSRPGITLAMILCGIVGAAGMAAASAATLDDEAPAVSIKYNPDTLGTEAGARALYRRIVFAAAEVCPNSPGQPFVAGVVRQCRDQAIARAVLRINNPKTRGSARGRLEEGVKREGEGAPAWGAALGLGRRPWPFQPGAGCATAAAWRSMPPRISRCAASTPAQPTTRTHLPASRSL